MTVRAEELKADWNKASSLYLFYSLYPSILYLFYSISASPLAGNYVLGAMKHCDVRAEELKADLNETGRKE